jgi:hypothetical protein
MSLKYSSLSKQRQAIVGELKENVLTLKRLIFYTVINLMITLHIVIFAKLVAHMHEL